MEIFISYNSQPRDTQLAMEVADLAKKFTPHVYFTGDQSQPVSTREETLVTRALRQQVEKADIIILIGTSNYLKGFWCELELNLSLEKRSQGGMISIIPFWFDPEPVDALFATLNTTRITNNDVTSIENRIGVEFDKLSIDGEKPGPRLQDPDINKFCVREERDLFQAFLERHDERLTSKHRRVPSQMKLSDEERHPGAREPKFMLYEHHGSTDMSLIILDLHAKVDLNRIRSFDTNYRKIKGKAQLDLSSVGFQNNEVHPMFRVEKGDLKHVILDSNILFQALMFPDTPVVLPGSQPNYKKQIKSISSFFRALKDLWAEKLEFAYCTSRPWTDDILWGMINDVSVYTRFAPTPSNSLHLGHLKAAILTYLHTLKRDGGKFLLRFDDTDSTRVEKEYYEAILSDLRWAGIYTEDHMIRHQHKEKDTYKRFIDVLVDAGLAENSGGGKRILPPKKDDYYFWVDASNGPIIRRGHMPTDEEGNPLNLDIEDENGNARYKLAGTIDDILFSSHIFRGRQQLLQGLTDRQAYIHSRLRQAIDELPLEARTGLDSTINSTSTRYIEVTRRPFPLFSPLIYCHLGEVKDSEGNILSKRNNTSTISSLRDTATILPEAAAAHFVHGFFSSEPGSRNRWHRTFTVLCKYGLDAFYATAASNISFKEIRLVTQQEKIEINDIKRWERRIIYNASLASLQTFLTRIPQARLPAEQREAFSRQLKNAIDGEIRQKRDNGGCKNRSISCWDDINALCPLYVTSPDVLTRLRQDKRRGFKDLLLSDHKAFERSLKMMAKETKSVLRRRLFNGPVGPRLASLPSLIGMPAINALASRL